MNPVAQQTLQSEEFTPFLKKHNCEELLLWGKEELCLLGEDEARISAERILEEVTGWNRAKIYLELDQEVPADLVRRFVRLIEKRKKRIPLAYITGNAYFWNEELEVTPECLIPRPETELMIEKFIEHSGYKKWDEFSFLDLCAGSGAIGIALMRHFVKAQGFFSDISKEALEITARNLGKYNLTNRAKVICSNLFHGFENQKWDAIVCNPPYLSDKDWDHLEPELFHEPRQALAGGSDGLDYYRRIISAAKEHLNLQGWLIFEVGLGQSSPVSGLLEKDQYEVLTFKDLNGIDRTVMGRKK